MSAPRTPLPLAPLSVEELQRRFEGSHAMCGYRCEVVMAAGDDFKAYDLETLREYGREAADCRAALIARGEHVR